MSNDPRKFSVRARLKSFVYAGSGIYRFFRTEHNAQIHLVVSIVVAVLCVITHTSRAETAAVVFSIALVWMAEMFNTSIEKSMDFITEERHPQIKTIKDIAAGAVLVAAIAAVIIGCIIFIPKFF